MPIVREEIKEIITERYGAEMAERVGKIQRCYSSQYSFKYVAEFIQEWDRITAKLKDMYGDKLEDIVIVPSNYSSAVYMGDE
jgi:hypothetical protein